MNNREQKRLQLILTHTFYNNVKESNDALETHLITINDKQDGNKNAHIKHKEDIEFKKKKNEYDKQYHREHDQTRLQSKKDNYPNDIECQQTVKEKQQLRYLEFNKVKTVPPTSVGLTHRHRV